MTLKKKMAESEARSMGSAIKGNGKFANKPATTTMKASAKANTRLRTLKLANIFDNFDIATT